MALAKEMVGAGFSPGQASGSGGQYATIAATGSAITDAARITASMVTVSAADGTKGVFLDGMVGDEVWLFNNSASTLKVYGDSASVAISVAGTGLGTAGTAFAQLTYKSTLYKKFTSTQWIALTSA